jgi:hypothetical protein
MERMEPERTLPSLAVEGFAVAVPAGEKEGRVAMGN